MRQIRLAAKIGVDTAENERRKGPERDHKTGPLGIGQPAELALHDEGEVGQLHLDLRC